MRLRSRKAAVAGLLTEVDELAAAARSAAGPELHRRLLGARHRAGIALVERPPAGAGLCEPDLAALPAQSVPEVGRQQLTPGLVRAALLRRGCLLVRGLVAREDVERLIAETDRALAARAHGGEAYEPLATDPRYDRVAFDRGVVSAEGWGGLWPADAPDAAAAMFAAFERAGLLALAEGYLGERPAISVNKSLLRRIDPPAAGTGPSPSAWHQDGAFLGDVRALNAWLALSRCGDVAPGLDVVPRRLDGIVAAGGEGSAFDWSVSQAAAERAAGEDGIVRPVFAPGDVLLFDERLLHATAAQPGMSRPRYAVECWFFAPSAFPEGYAPLAV